MQETRQYLNGEELLDAGNKALLFASQQLKSINSQEHPIIPQVQPGFLRQLLPQRPPQEGESMELILKDTAEKIFPGLTHWTHPNFYAYYGSNLTDASIISEILATAFGSPGFQWIVSPAQTELENIVVDWIVHAMNLPEHFLLKNSGGGTIANSTSDAVFITIHVAKMRKMKELGITAESPLLGKFVGYYSENAHGGAHKGLLLKDVHHKRSVKTYYDRESENYQIDLNAFRKLIEEDLDAGLIPFWFQKDAGEQLQLATICEEYQMWFNVDAAYSGSSWIIPEYREQCLGLDRVDSLQFNFSKMMMTGQIGTLFYIKEKNELSQAMGGTVDYQIYQNKFSDEYDVTDYKDWQIALSRRFGSLKLWFMIRNLGVKGMQAQLQEKIELSKYFESMILQSTHLSCFTKNEITLNTIVVKHKDLEIQNKLTKILYQRINEEPSHGFISCSEVQGHFFLRVVVSSHSTTKKHLKDFYEHIEQLTEQILKEQ